MADRFLDLWQKQEYTGIKPGLERIRRFLEVSGNPHLEFDSIQIAGTNGKGSTALFCSEILAAAGYRTGLYTSPHLVDMTERIRVNGTPISRKSIDSLSSKYRKTAKQCGLTFFEFITGLAFIYFAKQGIDIAVLETGLGGRYDATNIVPQPLLSIVTDIDYDHTTFLGKSLQKIAWEKAGIIKNGAPVISGVERLAAQHIIAKEARKSRSQLFEIGKDFSFSQVSINWPAKCQRFHYKGLTGGFPATTKLLGEHQAKNCSLALAGIEVLNRQGYRIERKQACGAVSAAEWPGRFDIRTIMLHGKKRTVLLDGAHNPGAVERFTKTLRLSPWVKSRNTFIFGILQDKDFAAVIEKLAPYADRVITVPIDSPRNIPEPLLLKNWQAYLPKSSVTVACSFADALEKVDKEGLIIVTGSLYLVGEALKYMRDK